MKITIEQAMSAAVIDIFYKLYAKAFAPLLTAAAARHMLTVEEFTEEMLDDHIDKYVVWGDDGEPVALTTLATHLSALPWISAEFYAARYPDQVARGAVYYVGYTLVHPDHEREGIAGRIIARIVRRMRTDGAVCGFDVSAHNDDVHHIGASIAGLTQSLPMRLDTVDVQTYYVADFAGNGA